MDLACWRQENGLVVRIWGSEYLLSPDEWSYLRILMDAVDAGKSEALGEEYIELCQPRESEIDLVALGLVRKREPLKRRF